MSIHVPVVIGEAWGLRAGVEGLLTNRPDTVTELLTERSDRLAADGLHAMFSSEVEFMFAPDPSAKTTEQISPNDLYLEVVAELQDARFNHPFPKGAIVLPQPAEHVVMVNPFSEDLQSYNGDGQGPELLELRPTPSPAPEAWNKYWKVIDAIGVVAARRGLMGMIASTQVNAAVLWSGSRSSSMARNFGPRGGTHTAAIHHNMVAMYPFRVEAGLKPGIALIEAYPEAKDTFITVHDMRHEFRHGTVGVADMRVDMLATLDALDRFCEMRVPRAALRNVRSATGVVFPERGALESLYRSLLFDTKRRRFVLPAFLESTSRPNLLELELNALTAVLTGGKVRSYKADDGEVIQEAIRDIRCNEKGELSFDPDSRYAAGLAMVVSGFRVGFENTYYRTLPTGIVDSSEIHKERRKNALKSSIVRRILGEAARDLVPADEAIRRRQELIETSMVTHGDDPDDALV